MGFRQPGFRTENGEGESRGEPWEPGLLKAAGPSTPGSSAGKGRGSQELGSGHGLGPGWERPRRVVAPGMLQAWLGGEAAGLVLSEGSGGR